MCNVRFSLNIQRRRQIDTKEFMFSIRLVRTVVGRDISGFMIDLNSEMKFTNIG